VAESTTIRELLVSLGVVADTDEVHDFDKALAGAKKGMGEAAKVAKFLAAAIAAAATTIGAAVVTTANFGDENAKAARRVGETAEGMQELAHAAELSGANMAAVETGINRMSRVISDAEMGLKSGTDALDSLGLSLEDLRGADGKIKRPTELLDVFADSLLQVEAGAMRSAAAQRVFGRGGSQLLPMLDQGSEAMRAMRQEARDLGYVMSNEAAAASEEFVDRLGDVKKIAVGLRNTLGMSMMPTLTEFLVQMRDWFKSNRMLIKQRVEAWGTRVAKGMQRLRKVIGEVDTVVKRLVGSWGPIIQAALAAASLAAFIASFVKLRGIVVAIGQALVPVLGFIGTFTAPQILAAVAALAAAFGLLYLVIDDVRVFLNGGESALGAFIDRMEGGSAVLDRLRKLGAAFLDFLVALKPLGSAAFAVLQAGLQIAFSLMAALAGQAAPDVVLSLDALIAGLQAVTGWLESMNDRIDTTIGKINQLSARVQGLISSDAFQTFLGVMQGAGAAALGLSGVGGLLGGGGQEAPAGVRGMLSDNMARGSVSSVSVGGDTFNVTGGSASAAELQDMQRRQREAKVRRLQNAVVGGPV